MKQVRYFILAAAASAGMLLSVHSGCSTKKSASPAHHITSQPVATENPILPPTTASNIVELKELRKMEFGEMRLHAVAVSPDRKYLAVGGRGTIDKYEEVERLHHLRDNWIYVLDAKTFKQLSRLDGHDSIISELAFVTGNLLISSIYDDTFRVWELGELPVEILSLPIEHAGAYQFLGVSPDGRLVATMVAGIRFSGFKKLRIWDAASRQEKFYKVPAELYRSIAISSNGHYLATGQDFARGPGQFSREGLMLREISDSEIKATELRAPDALVQRRAEAVSCVQFSPDGTRLYSGSFNGLLEVWNVSERSHLMTFQDHIGGIHALALSPDGRIAVSGGGSNIRGKFSDCALRIWRTRDGALLARATGHTGIVGQIAFSPDGKQIYSVGSDHTLRLWDLTDLLAEQAN